MRKFAVALAATALLLAGGTAASIAATQQSAAKQQAPMASQPAQQKMAVKKQHHRVAKTSKRHHRIAKTRKRHDQIAKTSSKRHVAKASKRHHVAKARTHRMIAKPRQGTTTLQQSTMQPRKVQARRPVRETTGSGAVGSANSAAEGNDPGHHDRRRKRTRPRRSNTAIDEERPGTRVPGRFPRCQAWKRRRQASPSGV